MSANLILAIIPARGGSKGLPGKNIRPLAGVPLIAHALKFAAMCPEIGRSIVSTDNEEIAASARSYGGEVPFMRPAELSGDDMGMMPVIVHAVRESEKSAEQFPLVLLLHPTNPVRYREDLVRAIELLGSDPHADGVIAVCRPDFNPRWVCFEEREGYAVPAFDNKEYKRRQDVPDVFRVTGSLYLWRREYILNGDFGSPGRMKMLIVPPEHTVDIDHQRDIDVAEALITAGLITLPWLATPKRT
jgi:CMP-N,N'-diacetyllegionaminic acid synthase